jgi:hypothetical protein
MVPQKQKAKETFPYKSLLEHVSEITCTGNSNISVGGKIRKSFFRIMFIRARNGYTA